MVINSGDVQEDLSKADRRSSCFFCRIEAPERQIGASGERPPSAIHTFDQADAEILQALAAGASSVKIAAKLHLSRQAIDYHINAMLRALKAANRAGLVSKAYSLGILMAGHWPPKIRPDCVRQRL